jgi:hypothetical protein
MPIAPTRAKKIEDTGKKVASNWGYSKPSVEPLILEKIEDVK